MRVVGLMSGTSHDAIDVAVADLDTCDDAVLLEPLGFIEHPIPPELDALLRRVIAGEQITAFEICRLDTEFGQALAAAAQAAIDGIGTPIDLIASHGQTVYHWEDHGQTLGSLQIGNAGWIAERTGVTVVSDLRIRDIAAGGNGAPLASTLDVLLAQGRYDTPTAFLNLGGISNMTVVGREEPPIAYDIGPANALIDAVVSIKTNGRERFDTDGRRALSGTVDQDLLDALLAHPYYELPVPKTTGKETFGEAYALDLLARFDNVPLDDVLATLTEHAAIIVATDARQLGVVRVLASGGGVRNPILIARLRERLGDIEYLTIDALGVPAAAKEAYMIALVGFLTVNGLAGNIPSSTGADRPVVLGSVIPGASPLSAPSRLEIVEEGI